MNLKRVVCKGFLLVSLVVSVFSVLLPWVSEERRTGVMYIPEQRLRYIGGKFWSYQAVIEVYGARVPVTFSLWFQGYWYYYEFLAGWILVFVFQVLMAATGALSMVREKVKGYPLPLITAFSTSTVSLILGYYQFLRHSAAGGAFDSVSIDIGFLLAFFSAALWLISLLIYARYEYTDKQMHPNVKTDSSWLPNDVQAARPCSSFTSKAQLLSRAILQVT